MNELHMGNHLQFRFTEFNNFRQMFVFIFSLKAKRENSLLAFQLKITKNHLLKIIGFCESKLYMIDYPYVIHSFI